MVLQYDIVVDKLIIMVIDLFHLQISQYVIFQINNFAKADFAQYVSCKLCQYLANRNTTQQTQNITVI